MVLACVRAYSGGFIQRPCGAKVFYEVKGSGIPVLLLAPGGMRSSIPKWANLPYNPWTSLPETKFRLIGMDQRFANRSTGIVRSGDGWQTFLDDQLALLDYLKIEKCHLLGACIGPSFAFQLLRQAPDRFEKCVMLQPIGLAPYTTEPISSSNNKWEGLNRSAASMWFGDWAKERNEDETILKELYDNMFGNGRDFVFSTTREEAAQIQNHRLLVFMGQDMFHPSETSREICNLVPEAELIETWRDAGPDTLTAAASKIDAFLSED